MLQMLNLNDPLVLFVVAAIVTFVLVVLFWMWLGSGCTSGTRVTNVYHIRDHRGRTVKYYNPGRSNNYRH